jgi:hypothetical protein
MARTIARGLRITILAAIVLSLLGGGRRTEATTVIRMDAAELSEQADLIFTGTAVQTRVVLSKDATVPFTFVTFAVDEVLKGSINGNEIVLRFDGGDIAMRRLRIEGMPVFDEGQSYLLFVRGNGSAGCPILGWWQGQFRYAKQAGSEKRILIDSEGSPLLGIDQGRFKRALPAESHAGAAATVVSSEGVEIVPDAPQREANLAAHARAAEPRDAAQVIDELRSFVAGREAGKNFRPGRLVESARIEDVPAHGTFAAARPH